MFAAARAAAAVPLHCEPQSALLAWLSSSFHSCVPTPLALFSTVLGSLSFVAWLFAQLPQIYKNYQVQSTAGLSFLFLAVWLLGDTTNLAGAILTKQATWQVLVASYYTFVDCILVFQYCYYTHYLPRRRRALMLPVVRAPGSAQPDGDSEGGSRSGSRQGNGAADREVRRSDPLSIRPQKQRQREQKRHRRPEPDNKMKSVFGSFRIGGGGGAGSPGKEEGTRTRKTHLAVAQGTSFASSPKTVIMVSLILAVLAQASPLSDTQPGILETAERNEQELIGTIVSWVSTVSYLTSRFPQIIKNARRKSTAGLSITLFIAAFFGNFFYSTSLLTNPLAWGSYPGYGYYGWADADGSDQKTWILLALPFFLGAAGVLSLDLTVFIQFLVYGGGNKPIKVMPIPDERGRTTWRSVSGYMRGWVPSPGPGGWRSRLPSISSRESSVSRERLASRDGHDRLSLPRDENRPLLADRDDGGAEPPFLHASQFRPGSPLRPGGPSPLQIARGRLGAPGNSSVAGSPMAGSPIGRSYGAAQ